MNSARIKHMSIIGPFLLHTSKVGIWFKTKRLHDANEYLLDKIIFDMETA